MIAGKRIAHALTVLTGVTLMLGLVETTGAALVASDFNAGGTDTGYNNTWGTYGSGNIFITGASDLTYANYFITQAGTPGNVYACNTAHNDRMDSRNLTATMSGDIWFTVLVNVPAGAGFAGLSFDDTATSGGADRYSHQLSELRVVLSSSALIVDMDGGAPPTATGSETGTFSAGTTHLILGHLNVAAGNDTVEVWVSPDLTSVSGPGDLPAANFTSTTVDFMDSIAKVGVPLSWNGSASPHIDAIWLSDTASAFEDVTGVSGADTTAPGIAELSPTNTATDVAVGTDLVITFDEDVAKGTNGNVVIQQIAGGTFETIPVTSAVVTVSGSNATINPAGVLAGSTGYYVEIDAGAFTDLAAASNAFVGISGSNTWNFVTAAADVTAPSLAALSPTNNATGVSAGSDLVITFDENVQKGSSGNIVIQQSAGGIFETIPVTSGSVTVSGSNVTINPSTNLDGGSNYYVEIDSGAIEDLSGNDYTGFSGSGTWSFEVYAGTLVATDLNVGGTDTGFSGNFYNGSGNVFYETASDLTYGNYGISQTGTTQRIYSSNAGPDRQDLRNLTTAMSGEIWFTVLAYVPTAANYAGLTFNSYGNSYDPVTTDARILMTPSQIQVGLNGGGASTGTGTFSADTTHLLLGKMNVVAGNDTISVWVDPDLTAVAAPGDLPAANYTSTAVDFADSITVIGAAGRKGAAVANTSIDAIWLSDRSTAFVDVTGVTGPDVTPPLLADLSPTNTATGVSEGANLVITLDENVAKGTNGNIVIQQIAGGTFETIAVTSANVTVSSTDVTIDPVGSLAPLTGYYVEIDAGAIKDTSGNAFAGFSDSNTWSFVTANTDVTAPSIAGLSPTNNATGVAVSTDLVISFDEDVAKGSSGNIVIQQSAGGTFETIPVSSGSVTVSGTNVTISTTSDFTKGTGYYVEIDNGAIEDVAGNPFAGISGSGTWSFEITPGAFASADFNTGGADTGFSGGWAGSGNVFITTTNDLVYGEYAITQSGSPERVYASNAGPDRQDTRNLATVMAGDVWFSVLVRVPSGTTYAGITFSNYGNTYDPVTTEARILMTPSQVQVGFNGGGTSTGSGSFAADTTHLLLGQMNVVSGNDTISVWVDPDLTAVTGPGDLPAANYTSAAVDFSDSITSVGVAGRKGAGSEDVHMDAVRVSDRSSAFNDVTGLGVVETTPPTIASLSPTNNATLVEVETDLVITFSEPVKKGSGNIVIQQTAGGTFETIPVGSAAVTLLGGGAVSINPSVNFAGATAYHVEIAAGAFTDFAATPNNFAGFSGSGTWSFTTEVLDGTPPSIAALSPGNGATGVSMLTDLVISFDEDVQKGASGNIVIQQTAGGTFETIPVTSGSVTVSGSNVTINPAGILAKGTAYYVEIDSGAIRDLAPSPNDFAGISGADTWDFTVSSGSLAATDLNTGGTDSGFSGGWSGSSNLDIINATDLASLNYFITQGGSTERVYQSDATANRQDSRSLAVAMAGEVWFSILVHVPTGGAYAGISFHSSTPSAPWNHSEADAKVVLTASQLVVDLDGGDPPTATGGETGSFAADTTHLLLGQMIVGAGNDTINVWVNPDLFFAEGAGDLPTPNFTSTGVDFMDLITIVGVPGARGSATEVYMDAIWVSDTATAFRDVVGPRPGTTVMKFK